MVFFLCDESADAGIQAAAHVQVGGLPGQHHDLGYWFQALQAFDHFHAVQAGQADVEHYHVRAQVAGYLRHFAAVTHLANDMKTFTLQ